MAKISLRAYNREIEGLIDHTQIDEAIAHCKFILKLYPKYVDTYRVLGKAYLEGRRYSEAADIFQRVLTVIPDDFISHLGLSIIREDEHNLDASIWHMERAFEVQPSNAAIQEEIRRLYGQRDGIKPPKARLTRAALIRMYAHGELYSQAIAEAQIALSEDAQRIDIEVLLARLYYLAGQKVDATQTCSNIVNKMPYCYEANKILAIILSESQRDDEAKKFQQRIYAVDPYAAYINQAAPTIQQVPDQVISLEKLDYIPGQASAEQPVWAQVAGVEIEPEENESLPDWLPDIPKEKAPIVAEHQTSAFIPEEPEAQQADIPEWMRGAGWQSTDKTETELAQLEQQNTVVQEPELEAEPSEIPEWLRSIQSSAQIEKSPIEDIVPPEDENLSRLEEILTAPQETPPAQKEDTKISLEDIPAWLSGLEVEESPAIPESQPWEATVIAAHMDEQSQPETSFQTEMEKNNQADVPQPPLSDNEDLPDWLKGLDQELTNSEKTDTANTVPDIPDWIQGLESPVVSDAEQSIPLQDTEVTGSMENLSVETPSDIPEDMDSAFAWLETLAARQGAEEGTLTTKPEERLEKPPEWITLAQEEEEAITFESPQPEIETLQDQTESLPSLPLEESTSLPLSEDKTEQKADLSSDEEAAIAWMEALAARQGLKEDAADVPPIMMPEWISETLESQSSQTPELDSIQQEMSESDQPITEAVEEISENEFESRELETLFSQSVEMAEQEEVDTPDSWLQGLTESQPIADEATSSELDLNLEAEEIEEPLEIEEAILSQDTEAEIEAPIAYEEKTVSPVESELDSIIHKGKEDSIVSFVQQLILKEKDMAPIIDAIQKALYQYPVNIYLWQSLGDAFSKSGNLQEALDAYTKAEELIR